MNSPTNPKEIADVCTQDHAKRTYPVYDELLPLGDGTFARRMEDKPIRANKQGPHHAIAVLIKTSLDAVMELGHIKNKAVLTEIQRDTVEQIVERGHAAIKDAQKVIA